MSLNKILLEPGTLWQRLIDQTEFALDCGALESIATNYELLEVGDIQFLVRILVNLQRKNEAKKEQKKREKSSGKNFNPFLPYEEDLFVSDLTDTHLCLLNKFNAVDHHLLMITRDFEEQENQLNLADFLAVTLTLREIEGLVFYNSGKLAGASQRHKHLQLVPLPLVPQGLSLPISPWMTDVFLKQEIHTIPQFPFVQAIAACPDISSINPLEIAPILLEKYQQLLDKTDLDPQKSGKPAPYNLLMTREWMMVIPRSKESYKNISINSLGFAGALLVRNAEQMEQLKQIGPLTFLQKVGIKKTRSEARNT
ncbi:MAG: phosphorylase [Snowella sp.]|nr:MAG: phosphorylase [Snowella sp.]